MPSGSHGGFSGSHGGFSGGGRSSGGNRGSGSTFGRSGGSGSFIPRRRGPRHIRFGHRVYVLSTGRQSILSLILVVAIMLIGSIFLQSSAISTYDRNISMIEEEDRYYKQMVLNASVNTEYMVKGEVKDQFYKREYGKYYITYTFRTSTGGKVEGYTFSIYTIENLPAKGSDIWLAVNDRVVDSDTDSIPMDYINFTLEDDGEYLLYKQKRAESVRSAIITGVVVAALIGGSALVIFTAKKKQEEKAAAEKAEVKAKEVAEEKKRFCEYCGARVEQSNSICPQCGARLR